MIEKRLLYLAALTFLLDVRVIVAQPQLPETHSSDCLRDRVKCAYEKPLQKLPAAYSNPVVAEAKQKGALKEIIGVVTPEHFVLALTGQHRDDTLLNNLLSAWQSQGR